MNKGYSAIDIARYVINYSIEIGDPLSNLKLQKILYLIQGNFLRAKGEICFPNRIEAWDYGPVIPDVYAQFKSYGSNYIPKINIVKKFNNSKFTIDEEAFNADFLKNDDKELINKVVDECKEYSPIGLMELTHSQEPWINAYRALRSSEITTESIKEYFFDGEI